ncbi:MAG: DUF5818 domain-containing protein [Terriglobia bacterium]
MKDAGFSAAEVTFTATGELRKEREGLVLVVPGLGRRFHLAGPQREKQAGQRVKVTAKLVPRKEKIPARIVVETIEALPR